MMCDIMAARSQKTEAMHEQASEWTNVAPVNKLMFND